MKLLLQMTRKKPYHNYMANFCMSVVTDRYVAFLYFLSLAVAGSLHTNSCKNMATSLTCLAYSRLSTQYEKKHRWKALGELLVCVSITFSTKIKNWQDLHLGKLQIRVQFYHLSQLEQGNPSSKKIIGYESSIFHSSILLLACTNCGMHTPQLSIYSDFLASFPGPRPAFCHLQYGKIGGGLA